MWGKLSAQILCGKHAKLSGGKVCPNLCAKRAESVCGASMPQFCEASMPSRLGARSAQILVASVPSVCVWASMPLVLWDRRARFICGRRAKFNLSGNFHLEL